MRRRVARAAVGRLATIDERGRPHVVPVCFALEGDVLYSSVDEKPKRTRRLKRLQNIRLHPEVAVLVDHYEDDWSRLWWVRLRGTAHVIEEGPEHSRAVSLLKGKYAQYRTEPPHGAVIVVSIEEWRGWSAA
jgi:PPOX class probable F420-dependent enzyme